MEKPESFKNSEKIISAGTMKWLEKEESTIVDDNEKYRWINAAESHTMKPHISISKNREYYLSNTENNEPEVTEAQR